MDCNKEEAIRAKAIAEKKMESKDFSGARKIGVKAQQLYPDLENISQLLMVCEVHCSAEQKLFGNEMDWYGILQIDQKADELTIKKQYRKFALQLHPDKNKFSGAEAAFKLIGEAQTVLLNRDKRNMHDMKRRASVSKTVEQHQPRTKASWNSNVHLRNNFSGMNPQNQQQQHPTQPGNAQSTFWTMCPFCMVKYQYYRTTALHKSLTCQSCKKPFIAYETNMQAPPNNLNQQACPQKKYGFSKVEMRCQGNGTAENPKSESFQKNGQKAGCSIRRSEKVNQKRDRKPVVESSESTDSASSTDSEEDVVIDKDAVPQKYYGEQQPRRSSRSKQQVSYKENLSDDDDIPIAKRGKRSGSSCATEEENEDASKEEESKMSNQSDPVTKTTGDEDKVKQNENACFEEPSKVQAKNMQNVIDGKRSLERNEKIHVSSPSYSSSHEKIEAEPMYSFPRNDFNDFERFRTQDCFKVGQLWAVYDSRSGMPRFYARIKKFDTAEFKVQITWLEANPDDDIGKKWANADLPISCGKFSQGQSEITEDILMFSHLISWQKIKTTYKIYPRRGETWAIFKNWDLNWYSDRDSNFKRKFEYEYVEILSEYDAEGVGMCVALLEKVKGFVSVFCPMVQEGKGTFQVPPGELLRFSHRVPSFKLTGDEGLGVPSGSVELDPASMLFTDKEIETRENKTSTSGLFSKSSNIMKPVSACDGNVATHQGDPKINNLEAEHDKSNKDHDAHEVSSPGGIEVPDPEFYNFDADKSLEKFQIGQIWALYSDEDGLPKYYGWIKKIDSRKSKLKILVAWLESSSLPDNLIEWHDKEMPICCGRFVVKRNEFQDYDCTNTFSHLVTAFPVGRNEFDIFPRRGEVWALYKHWTPDILSSSLGTCEYDIVEVCEDNDLQRKVLILERVDGFNSVFRVGGSAETMTISQAELLRFSHSIPSFRLTDERGGSLRGFWELDPAALPIRYFSQS